jgi:hypothetical protein
VLCSPILFVICVNIRALCESSIDDFWSCGKDDTEGIDNGETVRIEVSYCTSNRQSVKPKWPLSKLIQAACVQKHLVQTTPCTMSDAYKSRSGRRTVAGHADFCRSAAEKVDFNHKYTNSLISGSRVQLPWPYPGHFRPRAWPDSSAVLLLASTSSPGKHGCRRRAG